MGKNLIEVLSENEVKLDPIDFEWASQWPYKWRVVIRGKHKYVIDSQHKYLHRLILEAQRGELVDHLNLNGLDNRRENLRLATKAQNSQNRLAYGKSGYKGVTLDNGRWRSQIFVGGKNLNLGRYKNRENAARAYDKAAVKFFGVQARINDA
jgi:hypothetical protein